jgi:uncharacterized protein YdeI (YjbR/CyaY-like superfamily)
MKPATPIRNVEHYLASGCGRCDFFNTPRCKVNSWRKELIALRSMLLTTQLTEEIKWGVPCYTLKGKNVVMLSALKDYCVLSFFKGSLLKDERGLLHKPGENSRAVRVMRFTCVQDINHLQPVIKAYISEAIELEKSGAKVAFKKQVPSLPEELKQRMQENPKLKAAFEKLTPGRQRGYIIYFSQAKQSVTRLSRIDKCLPRILQGKGLHD